jgi:hypothetical protein
VERQSVAATVEVLRSYEEQYQRDMELQWLSFLTPEARFTAVAAPCWAFGFWSPEQRSLVFRPEAVTLHAQGLEL